LLQTHPSLKPTLHFIENQLKTFATNDSERCLSGRLQIESLLRLIFGTRNRFSSGHASLPLAAFRDALRQLRFRLQGLLSCTSWGSEQFWISLFFAHSLSTKLQTRPATFAILSSFYPSPRPFARVFCTEVRLRCISLPFAFAPGRFSCSLGWNLLVSLALLPGQF
jgi:hypothetical protein